MTRIALVSCAKQKRSGRAPAADLYLSELFRRYRAYAVANADRWYILSAKHGLLSPDQVIAPYDSTLNNMSAQERREWATRVQRQLQERLTPGAEIIILAGKRYREGIESFLAAKGFAVSAPFEGLGIGKQLQRLMPYAGNAVASDIERFYSILARLSNCPHQGKCLREQSRSRCREASGVYFFQEPGEYRSERPDVLRIVRVGTHAVSQGSKATLWQRLRTHRGTKAGGGNHRGSIFRKHVGAAMLVRDGIDLPHWNIGSSAPHSVLVEEAEHEQRVSAYIGAMPVFWVAVPGEPGASNLRAFIERNAIALLSSHLDPVDKASNGWLGKCCSSKEVQRSGLWNINHVDENYDPRFLDDLEACVARTCQSDVTAPVRPVFPTGGSV